MDFITDTAKAIAVAVVTAIFALVISRSLKFILRSKALLIIPALIYVPLFIFGFINGYVFAASAGLVLAAFIHILIVFSYIYWSDYVRFRLVNKENLPSIAAYMAEGHLFFQKDAKASADVLVASHMNTLKILFEVSNSDSILLFQSILSVYMSNGYNPGWVDLKCNIDFNSYNISAAGISNPENWILTAQQAEQKIESLNQESDVQSVEKTSLLQGQASFSRVAALLTGQVQTIQENDLYKLQAEVAMRNSIMRLLERAVPLCAFKYTHQRNSGEEVLVKITTVVEAHAEPMPGSNKSAASIVYDKTGTMEVAAQRDRALMFPLMDSVYTKFVTIPPFEIERAPRLIGNYPPILIDIKEIDNYSYLHYKRLLMKSVFDCFVGYLSFVFAGKSGRAMEIERNDLDKSGVFSSLINVGSGKLKEEGAAKFGEEFVTLFTASTLSVVSQNKLDNWLKELAASSQHVDELQKALTASFRDADNEIQGIFREVFSEVGIELLVPTLE